jgi:LysM repeat protein
VQRRRVVLGLVLVILLVALVLPVSALGGRTVAGSAPTAGQEYVVQSGDTLASVAARVGGGNTGRVEQQLAREAGSHVLVPGEHLLIP